ncbi:MAG: methylenetetrahydrofolate reductase [NAD(P)H] [bacterium]|nr:methylenetetrahydrofolate reductase [NAD(P)H] [bacterium]
MKNPKVSFEFFPPKTPEGEEKLWGVLKELGELKPSFVSVTYGAGGTTQEKTGNLVKRICRETKIPVAAHITCVGANKSSVNSLIENWVDHGIQHIVALRGDPLEGKKTFEAHKQGYKNAAELVSEIKKAHNVKISVAGYPEMHPESSSETSDLTNLKKKVDAGADQIITQFFFNPENFLRFRDKAYRLGIRAPIIPGILPVTNFARVTDFSKQCGATIPHYIVKRFERLDEDGKTRLSVAAATVSDLCKTLRIEGVDQFHFYTLNQTSFLCCVSYDASRPCCGVSF